MTTVSKTLFFCLRFFVNSRYSNSSLGESPKDPRLHNMICVGRVILLEDLDLALTFSQRDLKAIFIDEIELLVIFSIFILLEAS